jgi:hypothetical protein
MSVRHSNNPHDFGGFDVNDDEWEAAKNEFPDALITVYRPALG